MNLYSNGERTIRATGRAYEAIYQAQGFRPYVEKIKENKPEVGAESEEDKKDGKADQNGAGAEDSGKGEKPAAGRKSAADK